MVESETSNGCILLLAQRMHVKQGLGVQIKQRPQNERTACNRKVQQMVRLLENAQRGTMLRLYVETFPDLEFGFGRKNPGIALGITAEALVTAAKDA